jgi:ABC-type dipeptide/oligopeptide/nickel transport system ATPase component
VVLAQALVCEPEIVIADEPTASLDALTQSGFQALLRELKAQMGISVLLISHSTQVEASLADRVLVMNDGRIVEEGRFHATCREPGTRAQGALGLRAGAAADAARRLESTIEEPVMR